MGRLRDGVTGVLWILWPCALIWLKGNGDEQSIGISAICGVV